MDSKPTSPYPLHTFYLAHPVAPDSKHSFDDNMAHTVHMIKLLWEWKIASVAPWHTMLLAIPDTPENRVLGLAVDCDIVKRLDGIILTGHRLSAGMRDELLAVPKGRMIIDLIGLNDDEIVSKLSRIRLVAPEIFYDYSSRSIGHPH